MENIKNLHAARVSIGICKKSSFYYNESLWKFRTVLGGLDKMKCTCRCGKTVIFVDHNSSVLRFQ